MSESDGRKVIVFRKDLWYAMWVEVSCMDQRLKDAESIVFDIGNVLLRFDERIVTTLLPEPIRGKLAEAMFGPLHLWGRFDLGAESNEAIAARIAKEAGLPGEAGAVLHVLHHFHEVLEPMPMVDLLDDLLAMGKRLYALTNYPEPSFSLTCRRFPFLTEKILGAVVSSREKIAKPDPEIFRILRDRFALDPAKTLFIDDTLVNAEAAKKAGFMSWHYAGEDRL